MFLLSNVYRRPHEPPENSVACHGRAHAPHVTDFAVGPYYPLREVEPAMISQHLLDLLYDELPILRVHERYVLLCGRGFPSCIETVDTK
jgi:hypothetical protein